MGMAKYVSVFQIHFGKPVPWLQQVFHHVNTLNFEMLGVYELVAGFRVYHWSLPFVHLGE